MQLNIPHALCVLCFIFQVLGLAHLKRSVLLKPKETQPVMTVREGGIKGVVITLLGLGLIF